MVIAIAITPPSTAQWVELGLATLQGVQVGPFSKLCLQPIDLLVVDGDNPGPDFVRLFNEYKKMHGVCEQIILGVSDSPVPKVCEWDPLRTTFLPKPSQVEEIKYVVRTRLEHHQMSEQFRRETKKRETNRLGYLSTLRLSDLLQMLCLNGWTGKIVVSHLADKAEGEVYLNVGVLIHAQCGALTGDKACHQMLRWGRCEFRFVEENAPVVQSIHSHWQEVILEGARLLDESGRALGS